MLYYNEVFCSHREYYRSCIEPASLWWESMISTDWIFEYKPFLPWVLKIIVHKHTWSPCIVVIHTHPIHTCTIILMQTGDSTTEGGEEGASKTRRHPCDGVPQRKRGGHTCICNTCTVVNGYYNLHARKEVGLYVIVYIHIHTHAHVHILAPWGRTPKRAGTSEGGEGKGDCPAQSTAGASQGQAGREGES